MTAADEPLRGSGTASGATSGPSPAWWWVEIGLLVALFFAYGGDPPPMVNEAHYLVKAKHFWQPDWCEQDLFVSSGKAHVTFYALFGWPSRFVSLETTAWIGRLAGWLMLAVGLQRLSWNLLRTPLASLGVALIWIAGVERGNLAGEWVVGGIEAKIPAYGLVLVGLAEMVDRRWGRVWIWFGAASAFHVLVGGWSVLAAFGGWWVTERPRADRQPLFRPALFLGGGLALFGLLPAVWLTAGATAEESTAAARIYSYYRIAHHLLPAAFRWEWYGRHALMIAVTAVLFVAGQSFRRRDDWSRLGWYAAGAVGLAGVGLGIGLLPAVWPDLAAKLLRYYWFRLTDFAVPLLLGCATMRVLIVAWPRESLVRQGAGPWGLAAGGLAAVVLGWSAFVTAESGWDRVRLGVPPSVSNRLLGWDADAPPEVQQAVFADWRAVCRWVRAATPDDEVLLTPRHQQSFKWYAHRAEVVNWKDVPQDARSLAAWSRRFLHVFPPRLGTIRVTIQYATLREYRQRYGVRYLIVDRRITGPTLPLVRVYPRGDERNDTYAVYRLPQ